MMASKDRELMDDLARRTVGRSGWMRAGVLQSLRRALDAVRLGFDTPESVMSFFETRNAAIRSQFRWDASCNQPDSWHSAERRAVLAQAPTGPDHAVDAALRYADWYARAKALHALTAGATYITSEGERHRVVPTQLNDAALRASALEREEIVGEAFRPVGVAAFLSSGSEDCDDADVWRQVARRITRWSADVPVGSASVPVSLFVLVAPMECDVDRGAAYLTLKIEVGVPRADLTARGLWKPEPLMLLWSGLQEQIDRRMGELGIDVPLHRPALEPGDLCPIAPGEPEQHLGEFAGPQDQIESLVREVAQVRRIVMDIKDGLAAAPPNTVASTPTPNRLIVNTANSTATFDGVEHELTEDQTRLLKLLHDRAPGWVSPEDFKGVAIGRADLMIRRLPKPIADYVVPRPGGGGGCRLKGR